MRVFASTDQTVWIEQKKVISNKAHCVFYVHVQFVKNSILIRALYLSLKHVNKVNVVEKIVMT